jgi:hypothetical protein
MVSHPDEVVTIIEAAAAATLVDGVVTKEEITLRLNDGATLLFSLEDDTDGVAPEVAELHARDGTWVFRPEDL